MLPGVKLQLRVLFPTFRVLRTGTLVLSRALTSRPHTTVDKIIRVDHAGEYGANRIYAGQAAVLGKSEVGDLIQVCVCACV